jgi:hypothetical protein
MPTLYCISQPGHEPITDVGSVETIEEAIRTGEPGRCHVDEISSDPLPSGHTSPLGDRYQAARRPVYA